MLYIYIYILQWKPIHVLVRLFGCSFAKGNLLENCLQLVQFKTLYVLGFSLFMWLHTHRHSATPLKFKYLKENSVRHRSGRCQGVNISQVKQRALIRNALLPSSFSLVFVGLAIWSGNEMADQLRRGHFRIPPRTQLLNVINCLSLLGMQMPWPWPHKNGRPSRNRPPPNEAGQDEAKGLAK